MALLSIAVCWSFFLFGLAREPIKINPTTVFFGEWAIIVTLANLHLYNLYQASEETYSYILIGCISFGIGLYGIRAMEDYYLKRKKPTEKKYCFELNKKLVYTLLAITLVFYIIDTMSVIIVLMQGGTLASVREQAQEGIQYTGNPYLNAFRIIVANPVSYAAMPIAAIEAFKKNRDNLILYPSIAIAVLRVINDGGRMPFILLTVCFLICFSYRHIPAKKQYRKNFLNKKITKQTLIFILLVIVGALFIYVVTLSRSGENTRRYTYYYFAMEPIMFEKWAETVDSLSLYGFGTVSFNGIIFPFLYLVGNIFKLGYPPYWRTIYDTIESIGTNWQIITSTGLTANSYVSIFFDLYFDARVFGIIFGMFAYGIFVGSIYNKAIAERNEKNTAVFCLVLFGLFCSFQFILFENIYFALAYLFISILFYKKRQLKEIGLN